MSTVSKSFTENEFSSYKATWTVSFTLANQTISPTGNTNPTFNIPTVTAKMVNANKNRGSIGLSAVIVIGGMKFIANFGREGVFTSGTTYTLPLLDLSLYVGSDNSGFVSGNKIGIYNNKISNVFASTVSSKDVAVYISDITVLSYYNDYDTRYNAYTGQWSGNGTLVSSSIAKLILNAPPTFTDNGISLNSSVPVVNVTTASITISSLSAKYGAAISSVVFKIGNQTVSRTTNGILSIKLNTEGTFTPTITVTDSRGQVTTKSFNSIIVSKSSFKVKYDDSWHDGYIKVKVNNTWLDATAAYIKDNDEWKQVY